MSETKTCPKCAETIKKAALVCRYCGHSFNAGERTVDGRYRPGCFGVAIIGLLAAFVISQCNSSSEDSSGMSASALAFDVCNAHGSKSVQCNVATTLIMAGASESNPESAEFRQLRRLAGQPDPNDPVVKNR